MKPLEFQQKAIEELTAKFKTLWNTNESSQLILKSPTGSGKTVILLDYIDRFLLENKKYVFGRNTTVPNTTVDHNNIDFKGDKRQN
jgi:replicative superfamily II helicase